MSLGTSAASPAVEASHGHLALNAAGPRRDPRTPDGSRVPAAGRWPARQRRRTRAGAVHLLPPPDAAGILRLLERQGPVALGGVSGLSSPEHAAGRDLGAAQRAFHARR